MKIISIVIISFTILVSISGASFAALPSPDLNGFDMTRYTSDLLEYFQSIASTIANQVYKYAKQLFWTLAAIEFMWASVDLALRGELNLNSAASMLARQVMVIGLFAFFLESWNDYMPQVVEKIESWASGIVPGAGSGVFKAHGLIGKGMELCKYCFDIAAVKGGWTNPAPYLVALLPSAVILISFTIAGAVVMLYQLEGYIMIPIGVVVLGLGSTRWTRSYAEGYLKSVVALALKMFYVSTINAGVFIMVLGVEAKWTEDNFLIGALYLSCVGIISVYLVKNASEMTSAVMSGGVTSSGGATVTGAAMAGAGMAVSGMQRAAGMAGNAGNTLSKVMKAAHSADLASFEKNGASSLMGSLKEAKGMIKDEVSSVKSFLNPELGRAGNSLSAGVPSAPKPA